MSTLKVPGEGRSWHWQLDLGSSLRVGGFGPTDTGSWPYLWPTARGSPPRRTYARSDPLRISRETSAHGDRRFLGTDSL